MQGRAGELRLRDGRLVSVWDGREPGRRWSSSTAARTVDEPRRRGTRPPADTGDEACSTRNGEWYAGTLGAAYVELAGASHLGTLLQPWREILGALTS